MSFRRVLSLVILIVAGILPATLFCALSRPGVKGRWMAETGAEWAYIEPDTGAMASALEKLGVPYKPGKQVPMVEGRFSVAKGMSRYGVLGADGGWQGGFGQELVDFGLRYAGVFGETFKPTRIGNVGAGLAGIYGWASFETFGPGGLDRFKGEGLGGTAYALVEYPRQGPLQVVGKTGWFYFKPAGAWDGARAAAAGGLDREYDLGGLILQWGVRYSF